MGHEFDSIHFYFYFLINISLWGPSEISNYLITPPSRFEKKFCHLIYFLFFSLQMAMVAISILPLMENEKQVAK